MAVVANAGAGAHEQDIVRVGFMPLTDCAALVMASVLGFDQRYGIKIELRREMSWSSVRDKLCDGALDASHALYWLVTGAHLGLGARQRDMAVLMGLSQNGQAITLSRRLASPPRPPPRKRGPRARGTPFPSHSARRFAPFTLQRIIFGHARTAMMRDG